MDITITIADEQIQQFIAARDYICLGRKIPFNLSDPKAYLTRTAQTAISDTIKRMKDIVIDLKESGE